MDFIAFLQRLTLWQLRLLAVITSILLSEILVSGMDFALKGEVSYDYLLTGLVASALVSFLVLTVIGYVLEKLTASQLQLQTIIEAEPECVKLLSAQGIVLQMNQAGLTMLEAEASTQVIGHYVYSMVLPPYRTAFRQLIADVFAGESGNLEFEIQGFKGTRRWLNSHAVPLRDPKGHITALLSVTRDITERKRSEEALRLAHEHSELLLNSMAEGVYGVDTNGNCTFVNRSFLTMLGYEQVDEVIGKHIHELIHHHHPDGTPYPASECQMYRAYLRREEVNVSDEVFWRKDGTSFPVEYWSHPLLNGDSVIGAIATFVDISERKYAEQQIRHLAYYDALTQLPNRLLLHDRLTQTIASSQRTQRYAALMFLDLDHFKPLNDQYGHDVGDLLLIEVAQRLNRCTRQMDTVARFGGDEFILMLRELDTDPILSQIQARVVAEKVRCVLSENYLLTPPNNSPYQAQIAHHCTASIGVVLFTAHHATQEDILKWADMAMYQAKERGGNIIHFYDSPALHVLTSTSSE